MARVGLAPYESSGIIERARRSPVGLAKKNAGEKSPA